MKERSWFARRWLAILCVLAVAGAVWLMPMAEAWVPWALDGAILGAALLILLGDFLTERGRQKKMCSRMAEIATSIDPAWREKHPERNPKSLIQWIKLLEWLGVSLRGEQYARESEEGKFILDWTKKLENIQEELEKTAEMLSGTEEGALAERESIAIRYLNRELQHHFGCGDGNALCTRRPVDLGAVIGDAFVRNSDSFVSRKIGFRRITPRTFVHSDAAMLAIVLDRLLDNAVRYTPENGTIGVFCREAGDVIRMSVEDVGGGILPEELPRVFERGFVGAGSDPNEHKGMGLFVAKSYVEMLGHSIEIQSVHGRGTKVIITMPIAPRPES